jgi:hypothetical protein
MILIFEAKSRVTDTVQFTRTIRPMRPDVKVLVSSGKLRRASEGLLIEWTKRQKVCLSPSSDTKSCDEVIPQRLIVNMLKLLFGTSYHTLTHVCMPSFTLTLEKVEFDCHLDLTRLVSHVAGVHWKGHGSEQSEPRHHRAAGRHHHAAALQEGHCVS